jgi:hypothetical protein
MCKESEELSQYSDGLQAGQPWFEPQQGKIFLFSTASRLALGPTQPPIQWVLGALSRGVKQVESEAWGQLYLFFLP